MKSKDNARYFDRSKKYYNYLIGNEIFFGQNWQEGSPRWDEMGRVGCFGLPANKYYFKLKQLYCVLFWTWY
jgi:hypothetical protein